MRLVSGTLLLFSLYAINLVYCCKEGTLSKTKGSCDEYDECIDGALVRRRCNLGQYFDGTKCDDFLKVDCTRQACIEGMVYERGTCVNSYDVCFNGRLHREMCPPLYSYNGISCVPKESCESSTAKCEDGHISNVDGSSYVECVHGEYVTKFCPPAHLFEKITKTCQPVDINLNIMKGFCNEASRKPLPDCSKYQECISGRFVNKQCPDGMLFDKDSLVCRFSFDAHCDSDSCIPGQLSPDPKDCGTYYKCNDDASKDQQSCGWLHPYFDPVQQECTSMFNKHCERKTCSGDWVKASGDCSEYTMCKNGYQVTYSCPWLQKYNGGYCSLSNKCEQPNVFLSLKVVAKEECTNGETKRVYGRCTEYMKCVNKHWKTMHCPKGQNFQTDQCEDKPCALRPVLNFCNLFMQAEKDDTYPCPFGYLFDKEVKQCVYQAAARCADGECMDTEIINHPTDCSKYKTCDQGKWTTNSCPSLFHFDIDTKLCKYWSYKCQYEPANCTKDNTKADPSSCKQYEKCVDDTWRTNSCWFWQHFDSNSNSCATFKYQCYKETTSATPVVDNSKNEAIQLEKQLPPKFNTLAKSQVLASKCTEGEVKSITNTCRWYTECIKGELVTKKCSPCMNFNPDAKRNGDKACDYVWKNPCKAGVTDPADMTTPIPGTTTTTPKPECTEGATRGVHGDCKKYQQCVKGKWASESCNVWGKYDTKSNSCVYFAMWSVTCA